MAGSAQEFDFQPALRLRQISASLFDIPTFFLRFSSGALLDLDLVRSPTSPLDFGFFSHRSSPFSRRLRSLSHLDHQKKWISNKVGLGIINLLDEETKSDGAVDSLNRKNIIFGPQVKPRYSVRSKSLPRNYMVSLPFQNSVSNPELHELEVVSSDGSKTSTTVPYLRSKSFSLKNELETMKSLSLVIGEGSRVENSSDIKLNSLPIPIGSVHGYVGSLREIELSEDYTCIISHGPNPKRTHIYGDCIVECHINDSSCVDRTVYVRTELPQEAMKPEFSIHYERGDDLSFRYACKKKLDGGDDTYTFRGERAFCSFDCSAEEIFTKKELEKAQDGSSRNSPDSSYHDDIFLTGIHELSIALSIAFSGAFTSHK